MRAELKKSIKCVMKSMKEMEKFENKETENIK